MPLSAIDVIAPAFERMKRQLFQPFRFGQWLRYAFVGLLAGEMGTAGGCGNRFSNSSSSSTPHLPSLPGFPPSPMLILGVSLLAILVLVVAVILLYVSSRMRFVLFDSVVRGECRVRHYWATRGVPAFRYFAFQILFAIAAAVVLAVLVGIPVFAAFSMGFFSNPRQHVLALALGGMAIFAVFLILLIAAVLVQVLIKDFVVPQMALDNATVSEGWGRLWGMMQTEKGAYAAYLGMKLVLAIAAGIVLGIVSVIVLLAVLIPAGGFGVITVLGGQAAGLTWNFVTIALAVVIGLIAALATLIILSLISVPSIVFFPAYSMHFFADRYPPLRALLFPPA